MTQEEFRILTRDKIRQTIEANLDRSPTEFALSISTNGFPVALVSTQLKYLQKAKKKLPSFYQARCIIPPQAYEQSSSERTAEVKSFSGKRCLDLTMGLGVDTAHFARNFEQVIALEPNPVLAEIGRHNLQLLGISNVEIVTETAEQYMSEYTGLPFDLIYVDPSRRDAAGKRVFLLEDCQPSLQEILPFMQQWGKELLIKLSPLYDIQEAIRFFPTIQTLYILSVGNDCKELVVHLCNNSNEILPTSEASLVLQMYRKGQWQEYKLFYPFLPLSSSKLPSSPKYLYEPDVAVYKARALPQLMQQHFPELKGGWNDPMGFFFSNTKIATDFPGRVWSIRERFPYKPKQLKKWLKQNKIRKAHILRREFPFSVKDIRKQLQISEGGDLYLICTLMEGEKSVFVGKVMNG